MTITLTVAECSEYHSLGEYYDDIETVEEAFRIYESIPKSRMNGIPAIGLKIHKEGDEDYMDTQVDLYVGDELDLAVLEFYPEVEDCASNFLKEICERATTRD